MSAIDDDKRPLTPEVVIDDILATEADVRALQHHNRGRDAMFKQTRRTDLMPGRHYAIALTALEEARLRVQEATRLEAKHQRDQARTRSPVIGSDELAPRPRPGDEP